MGLSLENNEDLNDKSIQQGGEHFDMEDTSLSLKIILYHNVHEKLQSTWKKIYVT